MSTVRVTFESKVPSTPAELWDWSTSVHGISTEMGPILTMHFPGNGIPVPQDHGGLNRVLGKCTFRLFGILPIDVSRLTFVDVDPGRSYVEQSQLMSMKHWRHERIIVPGSDGTRVIDKLEFTPRLPAVLAKWFISQVWKHRHAVLRREFRERRSAARVLRTSPYAGA
jgi:ligand-binding SRPBCC domain-containing protein